MTTHFPPMDPDDTDFRVMVWCSLDGTNDGSASDSGDLQGATISSHTATAVDGDVITVDSSDRDSISYRGVTYSANTTVTMWVSTGTAGATGEVLVEVTLSDGRVLQETAVIPIKGN